MNGGLVANRIDDTPVYMEDEVRMTGAVISDYVESLDDELVEPTDVKSSIPIFDEFVD